MKINNKDSTPSRPYIAYTPTFSLVNAYTTWSLHAFTFQLKYREFNNPLISEDDLEVELQLLP